MGFYKFHVTYLKSLLKGFKGPGVTWVTLGAWGWIVTRTYNTLELFFFLISFVFVRFLSVHKSNNILRIFTFLFWRKEIKFSFLVPDPVKIKIRTIFFIVFATATWMYVREGGYIEKHAGLRSSPLVSPLKSFSKTGS